MNENISVIQLINVLISEAFQLRASDIHFDPQSDSLQVRLRIDGLLRPHKTLSLALLPEIIGRIKILAALRTDEHQLAHDGRFRLQNKRGETVDIRVSIMPTHHGENAVLRLLARHETQPNLTNLGFSSGNQDIIRKALNRSQGLVLVTGPTGSGKTTTLYTLLQLLNDPSRSIITLEDPIEYDIAGVQQTQINQQHGLTFANGLRSILRQDPNVIMVGEIRDQETARLAVNAALTGHLLLSTLHTNSAAATIVRLLDLGIEPYLLAATIGLIVSQRLVRRIVNGEFQGRVGVQEVLSVNNDLKQAISQNVPLQQLEQLAQAGGMVPILADGQAKVDQGLTTREELWRVIQAED